MTLSRLPLKLFHDSLMSLSFFLPIPSTARSILILLSMTSRVLSPNLSTMRPARLGPMPFIIPPPRNLRIPSALSGIVGRANFTSICLPYFLSSTHSPSMSYTAPSQGSSKLPLIVMSFVEASLRTMRIEKPLLSLKYLTCTTRIRMCTDDDPCTVFTNGNVSSIAVFLFFMFL